MRIKSNEREPFIQALRNLRPDLKETVSELDDQLGVLGEDVADLLGRLQHTDASQESEVEGRDAQEKVDDNSGLDPANHLCSSISHFCPNHGGSY